MLLRIDRRHSETVPEFAIESGTPAPTVPHGGGAIAAAAAPFPDAGSAARVRADEDGPCFSA